ncbi:phosphotransferase enzyme family protein [Nocardiopsis composta]|uniref:Ser/Thr protein kinase RdoA (MazF antagonist) n=1 Tax=Nocardiopsis composta TaxID=157465 RepID=A0A7W8QLW1_9ACTN|nr:phosphotransferase [Nocardiopsis composta]MBB5432404.1 Ser/Thr protein kinase RdoA (MazF antagonist) [Nocardiopsis composta]
MVFSDIEFHEAARAALAEKWGVRTDAEPRRLYGGEESAAFALGSLVVRLGPRSRPTAEAEWCHAVALHAAASVPEAVAPLPAAGGGTVVRVDGRPMTVWPLVEGVWPDEDEPGMAARAARLLGRLHAALAGMEPEPRPVPSFLEEGIDGGAPPADPELRDPDLDRWLAGFHRSGARRQPVHGDFYAGNTLAADGALVAVLDWDEACVAAPEAEVASAAMEWTAEFADDLPAMRAFAAEYAAAGGPAGRIDDEVLVQFIRHRLRREAAYYHLARERGVRHSAEDVEYHERRMEAFKRIRP